MAADSTQLILDYIKREYLDDDSQVITPDTKLITTGIVDSFSMVSLLMFLEREFKIEIPDEKATVERFDTVNNIVALLREYGKG
jgi:acyl carrier protein/D-alanine--poly(phosphoribitol) ligase subunit 2